MTNPNQAEIDRLAASISNYSDLSDSRYASELRKKLDLMNINNPTTRILLDKAREKGLI